jgi:Ca2+/Na+ antiporter
MSSSDRLLLILHIGFAIFTLGPLTTATMATPRYIRRHDVAVLRYLTRATRIYGLGTLGIFLFGLFLANGDLARVWLSASMTLFVVAFVLLVLIERDQRRAIHALQVAIAEGRISPPERISRRSAQAATSDKDEVATTTGTDDQAGGAATERPPADTPAAAGTATGGAATEETDQAPQRAADDDIARVERGRIASISGVVALIWLVILFLMVWYSRG